MSYVELVVRNTPVWVYGVFMLLLCLGLSRLRLRKSPLWRAFLAPAAFLIWSAWAVVAAAAASTQAWVFTLTWLVAFLVGCLTCRVRMGGAAPQHLGGGVFLFTATAVPLAAYMLLFWVRYGLEVWAEFEPSRAGMLRLVGIAVSAAATGRTCGDFLRLVTLMKRTLSRYGCPA